MRENWKRFLINDAGAVEQEGVIIHFGNPERELRVVNTGNVIVDLSHQGLVSLHGKDTQEFLQGQFCNDVRAVDAGHSQINGYCSPKGRLLTSFRLFQRHDLIYMCLPEDLLEPTTKRLRMFVLRADVKLEDVSESLAQIGFAGRQADQFLREIVPEIPRQENEVTTYEDLTIIRLPGIHPRFHILGEFPAMKKLWQALDVHAAPVGFDAWRLLDIQAGIPTVTPATSEAFVPQMLNFQAIGAVSFKKGCYTGQEIVARTQYLGKLKRRLYLAHVEASACPQAGDALFSPDSDSGQGTGKVVNAAPHPDGGYELLAVIEISSAEQNHLHLHDANGPKVTLKTLPYPVE